LIVVRIYGAWRCRHSRAPSPDMVRPGLLRLHSDPPPDPDVFPTGAHAAFLRLDLENAQRLAEAAVTAGACRRGIGGHDGDQQISNALRTPVQGHYTAG
jgi:hypothetical protein